MSRILKRPMFSMGGSTGAGITSGLSRQGYHAGERVTAADRLAQYGPAPRGYNVYDFLTEWGLNMASSPPMGNVIQTAAGTAREPYGKMVEGKGKAGQLEYAMRAQAVDAANTENLKRDQMGLQKYLGELTAQNQYKKFGVMSPRPEYELKQADVLKDNKNIWDKLFSKNRGKWEGSVYYDSSQHNKGNVINAANSGKLVQNPKDSTEYLLDLTTFEEGDEKNIYWNDSSGEWFSVAYDEEKGTWGIDKEMSMVIGDDTEDYTDFSLKEMQNFIENKKSAEIIQSGDDTDENDLTKIVVENKLEEGMVHPTSDGTPDGEILDEYVLAYAKENKIPLQNKPDGSADDYKGMGGKNYWSRFTMNFIALKNKMKNENQPSIFKDTEVKMKKRKKDAAFKYFSRKRGDKTNYDKIKEGKLQMSRKHAPYLKEYEESLQTVVAEAN